jgi:uncharacterized metal-binding protein YceD (DUF177 family)
MSQDAPQNRPKTRSKTAGLTTWATSVRLGDLSDSRVHTFELVPTAEQIKELRGEMDLISLKKMRFTGTLSPVSKRDWHLEAKLGATVSQPCVTTLVPVTTRIDDEISRLYTTNYKDPTLADAEDEIEVPSDDTVEPLPVEIILSDIAAEALAIAMPDYPRAAGAELEITQFAQDGTDAMTDEDTKPFASLKSLRDKLEKDN